VFDLFTQAERTPDRSQGGLGIGLALVKSLVALHGGSVRAASPGLNLGSEFVIVLPRVRARQQRAPASDEDAVPTVAGSLRILVVDDNIDAAQTLCLLLEMQGHTVLTEFDGESALHCARQERPAVMLLDIGLPDMDGYELARRLRTMPETRGAKLVALTGYGQAGDRERTRAAGFDYHLVKPASLSQVMEVLAEIAGD
jgi:CheY-like chemotaxis protein